MQAGNNRPKDRVFYGEVLNKDLLSYDPENFPSWCNRSATFSIWWDPRPSKSDLRPVQGAYIISKFKKGQTGFSGKRTWSMYIGDGGVHSWGDNEVRINAPDFDWSASRHVALVFDHKKDEGCAYIDGSLLRCVKMQAGIIAKMDCHPTAYMAFAHPTAYMAFAHRIPGMWQPTVVMQDWRYYREALSAEEVRSREFLRVCVFVCVCMSVQSDSLSICASASVCSFSSFSSPSTSTFRLFFFVPGNWPLKVWMKMARTCVLVFTCMRVETAVFGQIPPGMGVLGIKRRGRQCQISARPRKSNQNVPWHVQLRWRVSLALDHKQRKVTRFGIGLFT